MIRLFNRWMILFFIISSTSVLSQPQEEPPLISLQFYDTPINIILQALAEHQHLNLIVADGVNGNYSLNLENINWNQALDLLMELAKLHIEIKQNIMLVTLKSEHEKNTSQLINKTISPLETLVLPIYYADLTKLSSLLVSNQALLSKNGKFFTDENSRTLIIHDTAESLATIKELVKELDKPIQQIMLTAHIVNMSSISMQELGVSWDMSNTSSSNGFTIQGFNVNLPVTSPTFSLSSQLIPKNSQLLSLELSALEAENNVEIIASPHLLTLNQHTASIKQGLEIPYEVNKSDDSSSTIEFKEAVLGLEVTPKILPNKKVELLLNITQNTPGRTLQNSNGGEALAINTQEIRTRVIVNHKETLVLGGIFQLNNAKEISSVPLLSKLPVLGSLFSRTSQQVDKQELVIFITPEIIDI